MNVQVKSIVLETVVMSDATACCTYTCDMLSELNATSLPLTMWGTVAIVRRTAITANAA